MSRIRNIDRPATTLAEFQTDVTFALDQLRDGATSFVIKDVAIGVTQTPVAHGLTAPPKSFSAFPQSDARVWRSAVSDARLMYLTASSATTVDITVVP